MRRARKKRREVHIVFIDVAKAFDVVLHDTIRKALIRKGIPPEVRATILDDMYKDSNEILRICEKFFDARGMSANAKKCQSMKLLPAKGKNVLSCTTTPHRYWKGVAMASLTYKDLVKYLGVHLDPEAKCK